MSIYENPHMRGGSGDGIPREFLGIVDTNRGPWYVDLRDGRLLQAVPESERRQRVVPQYDEREIRRVVPGRGHHYHHERNTMSRYEGLNEFAQNSASGGDRFGVVENRREVVQETTPVKRAEQVREVIKEVIKEVKVDSVKLPPIVPDSSVNLEATGIPFNANKCAQHNTLLVSTSVYSCLLALRDVYEDNGLNQLLITADCAQVTVFKDADNDLLKTIVKTVDPEELYRVLKTSAVGIKDLKSLAYLNAVNKGITDLINNFLASSISDIKVDIDNFCTDFNSLFKGLDELGKTKEFKILMEFLSSSLTESFNLTSDLHKQVDGDYFEKPMTTVMFNGIYVPMLAKQLGDTGTSTDTLAVKLNGIRPENEFYPTYVMTYDYVVYKVIYKCNKTLTVERIG